MYLLLMYFTYNEIGIANASLVKDKINKIEQMCAEKLVWLAEWWELKNIAGFSKQAEKHWSFVNKRNGELPSSFHELLEKWAELQRTS